MKLVTLAEMREIEKQANESGISFDMMIQNAGEGLAEKVDMLYGGEDEKCALGLVGSGNNGSDTLVGLSELINLGWKVKVYLVGSREADNYISDLKDRGVEIVEARKDSTREKLGECLRWSTVALDGVLGTGIKLPLKPDVEQVLSFVAQFPEKPMIVAVDCPSGVDCESGEAASACIPAVVTVCMAAVKSGLLKLPAFHVAGLLQTVDIGLPEDLPAWKLINRFVVTEDWVWKQLPPRNDDSHKGTYGTALIVAGSINYTGAVSLAAKAACRAGAGLVRAAVPGPLHGALAGQIPEVTWLILPHEMGVISESAAEIVRKNLKKVTSLLIGPGLGEEETTAFFIRRFFKPEDNGRRGIGFLSGEERNVKGMEYDSLPPLIIDADGLKLLARLKNWQNVIPHGSVLTPHPGEMAILTGETVENIQKNRWAIAMKYAQEWDQVVVLKGAFTVVADPSREMVVPVASSALAHAGTGDVLAGIIAGLMAQGIPPFEAAAAGAWLHGQAGMMAASWVGSSASVLAGDVVEAIPEVYRSIYYP
jgi:hydroxyethylthiazole kinase-like uncharacterized protein yjeF